VFFKMFGRFDFCSEHGSFYGAMLRQKEHKAMLNLHLC